MNIKKKKTKIYQLQKNLSEITNELADKPEIMYEVQKYSNPVGYLISPKLAEKVFDYLEVQDYLSDAELITSLIEARKEFEAGEGKDLDSVLKELDKE